MTAAQLALLSDAEIRARLIQRGLHRHHANEVLASRDDPDVAARIAVILTRPAPETAA